MNGEESGIYDVMIGNFEKDMCDEIKLTEKLVEKKNNLNSFSFKYYHYHKCKRSVQKECPSIACEIVMQEKRILESMCCSR